MKVFPFRKTCSGSSGGPGSSQGRPQNAEATRLAETVEGTRLADRYVVQEELISSGSIRLLLAREVQTDRTLLLRELSPAADDPSFVARMEREANRLDALEHPAVPKLTDAFEHEGRFYLVREHVGGTPLSQYRADNPELVQARAQAWVNSIAEVLEDLHSGIPPYVVGEFGPNDILVTGMGRIRFLPVRQESLQPPDLLEGDVPGHGAEPTATPPFFDVQGLVRLAWWMLTGYFPILGQAQLPLDPEEFPDLDPSWLKGLQNALDPTYPEPPQTITDLRKILLGHETVSSELPPKLEFEVSEVRRMKGPKGLMVQGTLHAWNSGGGELNGYCRSTQRWVRIIPNTFRGNDVEIEFWIDTSGMRAAEEHKAHVFIKSQNEEVDIPVHVTTAPHWLSELPDIPAVILPQLPGAFAMLLLVMLLWLGHTSALTTLEGMHEGSLAGLDALPAALLKKPLPAGSSSQVNAQVAGVLALMIFAFCPVAVKSVFSRYPRKQRQKLLWAELLGMLSPSLWLLVLWTRPTFNDITHGHPAFAPMDIKGPNLWMFLLVNAMFTVYLCSPVQARLDRFFRKQKESRRGWITILLCLVVLALAMQHLFL